MIQPTVRDLRAKLFDIADQDSPITLQKLEMLLEEIRVDKNLCPSDADFEEID